MRPDFENKYVLDYKMMKEFVSKTQCLTYTIVGIIILLGGIARIIINIIHNISDNMLMYGIVIFASLFVIFGVSSVMTKEMMGKDKFKGTRPQTSIRFADKIYKKEGKNTAEYNYSEIVKVHKLKRSYALMLGKRTAILVSPDGFTTGNAEDFLTFIKTMCPGAKIV